MKILDEFFPVLTTFINFVAVLILISVQMDYVAIGVGVATIVGSTLTGVWWIVNHFINKGMDKQHLKEFEQQTSKSFIAFSSDIKEIKDKVSKISEEQSEQKSSIARLEGKVDALQSKDK